MKQAVREQTLSGGAEASQNLDARSGLDLSPSSGRIPQEVADTLILNHLARHYRAWLDDAIPALDGKSPREAARSPSLRGKLVELLHGLEGQYEHALKAGGPRTILRGSGRSSTSPQTVRARARLPLPTSDLRS